jgi:hypothetical protein
MSSSAAKVDNMNNAINLLDSTNVSEVIRGLNYILQKSFEANEITSSSNVIFIEQYPKLLPALSNLLEAINPIGKLIFGKALENRDQNYYSLLFGTSSSAYTSSSSSVDWDPELPISDAIEFRFLSSQLDSNTFITTILSILRNLSFEIANEIYIAYHSTIMRHLSSIMISSILEPRLNENLQLVFDLFNNIASRLEFYGKRRIQLSSGFLEEYSHSYQQQQQQLGYRHSQPYYQQQYNRGVSTSLPNKDLIKFKMSYELSNQSSVEYTLAIKSLLPIINALISKDYYINRYFIIKSIELFLKLTSISENEAYFVNTPNEFLENLINLLCVSNTTILENNIHSNIIPENYIIIGDPHGKSRPILATSCPLVQTSQQYLNTIQHNNSIYQSSLSINNATATNFSNYSGAAQIGMNQPSVINATDNRFILPNSMMLDQVDHELRDLSLECLYYLCRISYENRCKVATFPTTLKIIYKMASYPLMNCNYYNNILKAMNPTANNPTTATGNAPQTAPSSSGIVNINSIKTEIHTKAALLLSLFAHVPEAQSFFYSTRTELLLLAASDDVFAGWTFFFYSCSFS